MSVFDQNASRYHDASNDRRVERTEQCLRDMSWFWLTEDQMSQFERLFTH